MKLLSTRRALRRFLLVLALRWLPVGMILPTTTLLMLDRGLSLPQVGLVTAAQGVVILLLELPTGGLADAIGRRPVLIAASALALCSLGILTVADSFAVFALVWAVQGVSRALDSGPLEAWFVDATLAADSRARLDRGLGYGGSVTGAAVASGALLSGLVIALDPVPGVDALAAPVLAAAVLQAGHLVVVAVLVTEPAAERPGVRGLLHAVRQVPAVIAGSVRLAAGSKVLLALLAVEVFWGFGMVSFEQLTPVRLEEMLGDADRAAAVFGPVTAAAWGAFAAGSALAGWLGGVVGTAAAAAALRIVHGAAVVVMGLVAGPVGLIAAFLGCYAVHGASNPLHMTLLHAQVGSAHRASVVSLNSLVAHPSATLGGIALTALAGASSVSVAMIAGGVVLALAAALYLPAVRQARMSAAHGSMES